MISIKLKGLGTCSMMFFNVHWCGLLLHCVFYPEMSSKKLCRYVTRTRSVLDGMGVNMLELFVSCCSIF